MLSHSDVHYLISLLLLTVQAPNVEIRLGDRIYDQGAKTKRDVDITLTLVNSDGTKLVAGVEVKDEAGPLDLIDIDHMINKMRDMPSILHKMIIASNGFSKPAIEKAHYHDISLVHFNPWLDYYTDNIFGVKFPQDLEANNVLYTTEVVSPIFLFRVGSDIPETEPIGLKTKVFTEPKSARQMNFQQLLINIRTQIANSISEEQKAAIKTDESIELIVNGTIRDNPTVKINGERITLNRVCARVRCIRTDSRTKPTYWCLRADGQELPYVACAIFDIGIGSSDLAGMVCRPGFSAKMVRIPATARSRRVVRKFEARFRQNGIGDLKDTSSEDI